MENQSSNQLLSEFQNFLLSKKQINLIEYLNSEKTDSHEKLNFIKKLQEIDFDLLSRLYDSYLYKENSINNNNNDKSGEISKKIIEPLKNQYCKEDFETNVYNNILNLGYEKIATGKVALLILAGGQGSRLGFSKAKGLYNIQMQSNKTLFEYITNRFLSIQNLAKSKCSCINEKGLDELKLRESILLIMTSKENHLDIVSYYESNNYFGLKPENIKFFPQDILPAIDIDGNIIIKNKFEIFEAPNGNGGCFIALKNEKILEFVVDKEVEYLNVISIDNPLTKTLDPFFIGLTYLKNQKMSAKTIPKTDPKEPVGVFVKVNNKPAMIDYAELEDSLASLRDKDFPEKLVFRASNILHYLISVDMLQKILNENYNELINDFHIAKKKITCYDYKNLDESQCRKFSSTSGVKFELFFNSIFLFAEDLMLYEVDRFEEFAPVKNNDDATTDNPKTTRQIMSNLFKKWLNRAGVHFKDNERNDGMLEISFLRSYDGENLDVEEIKTLDIDLTKGPFYIN